MVRQPDDGRRCVSAERDVADLILPLTVRAACGYRVEFFYDHAYPSVLVCYEHPWHGQPCMHTPVGVVWHRGNVARYDDAFLAGRPFENLRVGLTDQTCILSSDNVHAPRAQLVGDGVAEAFVGEVPEHLPQPHRLGAGAYPLPHAAVFRVPGVILRRDDLQHRLLVRFPRPQVGVHFLLMLKVVGDHGIHVRQGEGR